MFTQLVFIFLDGASKPGGADYWHDVAMDYKRKKKPGKDYEDVEDVGSDYTDEDKACIDPVPSSYEERGNDYNLGKDYIRGKDGKLG
jgi:hypothetical protein